MKVTDLLNLIATVAAKSGTSVPFIVGGLPRDKVMGRLKEIQDVDLTTGDESIHKLVEETNKVLLANYPDVHMKTFPDGHSQIIVEGMKVDFSSNYRSPEAPILLRSAGIKHPSEMTLELVSRDFTCNTLLLSMDLKTITDPTGTGLADIESKMLRTPLPPSVTLGNDNKRVVRIIYLAAKLDFDVEQPIIDWVIDHPESIQNVKPKYLTDKLNEAMNNNPNKTIDLLNKMNLWKYIPITESLQPYARGKF